MWYHHKCFRNTFLLKALGKVTYKYMNDYRYFICLTLLDNREKCVYKNDNCSSLLLSANVVCLKLLP